MNQLLFFHGDRMALSLMDLEEIIRNRRLVLATRLDSIATGRSPTNCPETRVWWFKGQKSSTRCPKVRISQS